MQHQKDGWHSQASGAIRSVEALREYVNLTPQEEQEDFNAHR